MFRILLLLLVLPWTLPAAAQSTGMPATGCMPAVRVPITVRIGADGSVVHALLEGGGAPPLQVVSADSGQLLWSAGPTATTSQTFAAMQSGFAGSLAVLDIDGDGLHDRIYAGDLAGRVWRFDLHHGAMADSWATGGVFADFSNDSGRGFVASPDVSLSAPPGTAPWLNIAIGTVTPANVAANNRFYVLRDYAVFESWSAARYRQWNPLHESDLLQLAGDSATAAAAHAGYFIELGAGQVLWPSITVSGRAVLAIAESGAASDSCAIAVSVSTLQLDAGTPDFDLDGNGIVDGRDWRRPLPAPLPAGSAFGFTSGADGQAACMLGDAHIAACDVDTRPVKTWWRREDAE